MRRVAILIAALLAAGAVSAQSTQTGRVVLQNSGKQALSGVQVTAYGAAPADTDGEGRFSLRFPSASAGDLVPLKEAYKMGYELVNRRETERWILSPSEMVIVMAEAGRIREARERYYGIGNSQYVSRYEQAVAEIERLNGEQKLTREEYIGRLEDAYAQLDNSQKLLGEYADLFARVNRDELGEMERAAFALVDEGRIDEAIALYEKLKLVEKLTEQGISKARLKDELAGMAPSLRRYADILIFSGGRENLAKAGEVYLAIVEADPTNYDNLLTYGRFQRDILDFGTASKLFSRAVDAAPTLTLAADAMAELGQTRLAEKDYPEAQAAFERAVGIYSGNWGDAVEFYRIKEAAVYIHLAHLYTDKMDFDTAIAQAEKGIDILDRTEPDGQSEWLATEARLNDAKARAMHKAVEADAFKLNDHKKNSEFFNRAIESGRRLVAMYDNTGNRLMLARMLNNIASHFWLSKEYAEAEKYSLEALETELKVAEQNPLLVQADLAAIYNRLGLMYTKSDDPAKEAEGAEYYLKATALREELAAMNPKAFTVLLIGSYTNTSSNLNRKGRYDEALATAQKGLELIERNNTDPATILQERLLLLSTVGDAYIGLGDDAKAEATFLEIVETAEHYPDVNMNSVKLGAYMGLSRATCKGDTDIWMGYIVEEINLGAENSNIHPLLYGYSMGKNYIDQGERKLGEKYLMFCATYAYHGYYKAEGIRIDHNSSKYNTSMWLTLGEIGEYYFNEGDYETAKYVYKIHYLFTRDVEASFENLLLVLLRETPLNNFGMASWILGDFDTARIVLNKLLEDYNVMLAAEETFDIKPSGNDSVIILRDKITATKNIISRIEQGETTL